MSDSSVSFLGSDRILTRLRLIASGGRVGIFEAMPRDPAGLEAFCVVTCSPPDGCSGFVLKASRSHRIPVRLGEVIGNLLRDQGLPAWLGRWCSPESQVGSRICEVSVPGVKEFYYVSQDCPSAAHDALADKLAGLLCSVGGVGHIPIVGATTASFVTFAAGALVMKSFPRELWVALVGGMALVSTLVCACFERWAQRHYCAQDPRQVVLDEVAGMAFAMVIVGPAPWPLLGSFVAFRFFDILKPGIHWIERRGWPGTIVWDDVLAGIYAGLVVKLAERMIVG